MTPDPEPTPDTPTDYSHVAETGTLRDLLLESKVDRPGAASITMRNGDDSVIVIVLSFLKEIHPGDLDHTSLSMKREEMVQRCVKGHGLVAWPLFHKQHDPAAGGLPHGLFMAVATVWPPHKKAPIQPDEWTVLEPQAAKFRADMSDVEVTQGREALRVVLREQIGTTPKSFRDAFLDRAIAQGIALALLHEKP